MERQAAALLLKSNIMRAAFFKDNSIELVERPRPEPSPGFALLKVRLAGICNTDVELYKGYYGFAGIPGHEFVAEVAQAPDAPEWEGKRVVADINFGCADCPECHAHGPRHCPNRSVLGIVNQQGAFAEYCVAPVRNLVHVPDSLDDEQAVFAEPLAAGLEVGQQVHLTGATRLAVLGDGKLGLLTALGLRCQCPELLLVGKHDDKLAIAAEQGVRTVRIRSADELPEVAAQQGPFDIVVEATGRAETVQQAVSLLRPEGVLVLKTTSHQSSALDLAAVVVNELTLMGSRCGDIGLAVAHLARGWLETRPLIEARYDFDDFVKAFAHARRPGARKVLVSFV